MSVGDCRYGIDQRVDVRWDDDKFRRYWFPNSYSDSGVVQKIREHSNDNGVVEMEYYIHYDDCTIVSICNIFSDDKRMEGWVPAKRISLFNKKSSKRPREPDTGFSEKVTDSFFVFNFRNRKANPL